MDVAASVTELDALLEKAGKLGFMVHVFHTGRHGLEVLAVVYQWKGCADVVVLFDGQHAHAYRMPTGESTDVFAPTHIYWWYSASAVWTLRALLTLPEPGHPNAPNTLVPAPPGAGIPSDRTPVQMRHRG